MLADDAVVETTCLNPLLVFGQGGKGKGSLPLEDCCQIGHQLQEVFLLKPGPKLLASPQVPEDWFVNRPELGQGYVGEMSSEEVTEEGGIVCLPPLALGHVGAFVIERTRVPPLLSEGGAVPRAHLRGVHGCFLADISCVEACWAAEEEEEGLAGARACLSPSEVVVV